MRREISSDQLNATPVDPDLVLMVLDGIADASTHGKDDADLLEDCAAAYAGFTGIDVYPGVDALNDDDQLAIVALASRVYALSMLFESGSISSEAFDPESIAIAAATARLAERDGQPGFQLLDFLARANRAAARQRS